MRGNAISIPPSLKSRSQDQSSAKGKAFNGSLFWPGTEGSQNGPLYMQNGATTAGVRDFMPFGGVTKKFYEDPAGDRATIRNMALNEGAFGPFRKRQNNNNLPRCYALCSEKDTFGDRPKDLTEGERAHRVAYVPPKPRTGHQSPIRSLPQLASKMMHPKEANLTVKLVDLLTQLNMRPAPPENMLVVMVVPEIPPSAPMEKPLMSSSGEGILFSEGVDDLPHKRKNLQGQQVIVWNFVVPRLVIANKYGRYKQTDLVVTPNQHRIWPGETLEVQLMCTSRLEVKTFFCGLAVREEYFETDTSFFKTRLHKVGENLFFQDCMHTTKKLLSTECGLYRVWGVHCNLAVPARANLKRCCISVGESWSMGLPDPEEAGGGAFKTSNAGSQGRRISVKGRRGEAGAPQPVEGEEEEWQPPKLKKRQSLVVYAEAQGTGARVICELDSRGWL